MGIRTVGGDDPRRADESKMATFSLCLHRTKLLHASLLDDRNQFDLPFRDPSKSADPQCQIRNNLCRMVREFAGSARHRTPEIGPPSDPHMRVIPFSELPLEKTVKPH